MSPRVAVVGAVALVGAVTVGLVAIGAGGTAVQAPPTTVEQTTTSATTTTTEPETRRATTTTVKATTSVAPTTTTPPPPTMAPIVTYYADIGVLAPRAVAAPVRVRIAGQDIDGAVIPVGVNEAAELAIPPDAKTLVWYRHGPTPGQPGSAVIAGHLNWKGQLGTFDSLPDTAVGETVTVSYDDGSERAFTVRTVELVDKPAVAVSGVFARDGESVLRLVTCGGEFNDETNHYLSNVIVTAVPA